MKKLLSILLLLLICLSFASCKQKEEVIDTTAQNECTEQEIRMLVEQNIDCYYMFYVGPLSGETADNNGYAKANEAFFADYAEFEAFLKSTYCADKVAALLSYPDKKTPLYKNVDGDLYVKSDAIESVKYDVLWEDTYTLEITSNSLEKCEFTITTETFSGEEYVAKGVAVPENDKWLLTDMVY